MKWNIQLCELNFDDCEKIAVAQVLDNEWLTMGAVVSEFEEKFSNFLGKDVLSIAVSSATAGLHLLLMAIGISPEDEVIMPGLTFVSDANVVMQLGAKPVFADSISLSDLNVSEDDIMRKITDKTKAIVVVHFAGYPVAMQQLINVCEQRGIFLIEDVAHAPGAERDNRRCGTFGNAAFFSFFSNKNLACGEGGMIVTKDAQLAAKLSKLRSHGMTSLTADRHKGRSISYDVHEVGLNYRLDEIRAAIGLVQLNKLVSGNAKRKELTLRYYDQLSDVNLHIPYRECSENILPAYHIFPVILSEEQNRQNVIKSLREERIQSSIHYPSFANFAAYKHLVKVGDLPVVDEISERELTLPLHPRMSIDDVDKICKVLKRCLA